MAFETLQEFAFFIAIWLYRNNRDLTLQNGKESPAAREAEARRRAMARKKAMDYQTRALRLHLGGPKLTRGRQNVDIQTDAQLEEVREYKIAKKKKTF